MPVSSAMAATWPARGDRRSVLGAVAIGQSGRMWWGLRPYVHGEGLHTRSDTRPTARLRNVRPCRRCRHPPCVSSMTTRPLLRALQLLLRAAGFTVGAFGSAEEFFARGPGRDASLSRARRSSRSTERLRPAGAIDPRRDSPFPTIFITAHDDAPTREARAASGSRRLPEEALRRRRSHRERRTGASRLKQRLPFSADRGRGPPSPGIRTSSTRQHGPGDRRAGQGLFRGAVRLGTVTRRAQ